jgi:integrase
MSVKAKGKYRKSIRINGKLITERFTRKEDAVAWYSNMNRAKERARAGLEIPFEPIAFEEFCANFIMSRQKNETNDLDETRIRLFFLPEFGPELDQNGRIVKRGRDLHSITRKEWKTLFSNIVTKFGRSEKTVNNIRALAHRIYEEARVDEPPRVIHNPISDIKPFEVGDKEIEIFETKEEIQKYLETSQDLDLCGWMASMIALNTGMREGEISALDEEDVKLEARSIRIYKTWSHSKRAVNLKTKTKHQRTIGINDALAIAIAHYRLKVGDRPSDSPFLSLPDGRRLPGDSILNRHKAALKKAKIPYKNFHATRHTFATHFLAQGGSIWDLKNILGHKSITTTERYAHRLIALIKTRSGIFQIQTPSLVSASLVSDVEAGMPRLGLVKEVV